MHLCTIATVTVHICMATVAFAYHILVFFFSLTLSSSLYPLWLSTLLFSQSDQNGETLSTLFFSRLIPLASTIADRHQSLTATTTDFHHHRSLISPPISDLSTNLIAFLYFWLFDQWVSGWMGFIWLSFGLNGISSIWVDLAFFWIEWSFKYVGQYGRVS